MDFHALSEEGGSRIARAVGDTLRFVSQRLRNPILYSLPWKRAEFRRVCDSEEGLILCGEIIKSCYLLLDRQMLLTGAVE